MKYLSTLLILFVAFHAAARVVVQVGSYKITEEQLQAEMADYEDQYSYSKTRQIALNTLIRNNILKIYADDKGITVDEIELKAFFKDKLGDLPRFQSNGVFDNNKYQQFKKTSKGKMIIGEMRNEILVNKTRTVIKNSLEISDEELLEKYFLENTEIDMGYAIIDVEDAGIPADISLSKADWYYERNKYKFKNQKKVKLKLFIVFDEEFEKSVELPVNVRLKAIAEEDTTLSKLDLIDIRAALQEEVQHEMAMWKAVAIRELLLDREQVEHPILETSYLGEFEKLGKLQEDILSSAFEMRKKQFSEPIDIGNGYLIFQVIDFKRKKLSMEKMANLMWKAFILNEKETDQSYQEYFESHFDRFIIPAAVITRIDIPRPLLFSKYKIEMYQQYVKKQISDNLMDNTALREIIREYDLKSSKEVIYLDIFENSDTVADIISLRIRQELNYDFIKTGNSLVFYRVDSYFPEYIPIFRKIKSQLPGLIAIAETDSVSLKKYYEDHRKDFATQDSLQLGGVFFQIETNLKNLPVGISDDELRWNYKNNIEEFSRNSSVKFEYIYIKSQEMAVVIKEQAEAGIDFSLLQKCLGLDCSLPQNKIIEYSEIPLEIQKALKALSNDTISQPVYYDEGWIVLHKIRSYSGGVIPFSEIKYELKKDYIKKLADPYAFRKAKAVFDSTSYFSHLTKFVDESMIFRTKYQNANLEYKRLGFISQHLLDLMRIWKNEKYSSIIKTEEGYAVVFVLKKRSSRQLTYEEALPQIEEIFAAKKSLELGKAFVSNLKKQVSGGADPDSLLFYLGGWKRAENLNLNSKIPSIDFSKIILKDIVKHKEGYCSPVFPVGQNKLFFYYLYHLERPNQNQFYSQKTSFKRNMINIKYDQWIEQYKIKKGIKIKY
jgi:parvulin-like peptidyl-prolyl isomerase